MADTTSMCGQNADNGTLSEQTAIDDPRQTMANMTRAMSNDFFSTAVPVKDDLTKMTTYNGNSGVIESLKSQGMAQAEQSFSNAGEQAVRNSARYGMDLTNEQSAAQESALSSGKTLAEVDASNRATMFQKDLNKQLVSGIAGSSSAAK